MDRTYVPEETVILMVNVGGIRVLVVAVEGSDKVVMEAEGSGKSGISICCTTGSTFSALVFPFFPFPPVSSSAPNSFSTTPASRVNLLIRKYTCRSSSLSCSEGGLNVCPPSPGTMEAGVNDSSWRREMLARRAEMGRGRGVLERAYSYSGFPSILSAEKIGGTCMISPLNLSNACSMISRVTCCHGAVERIGPSES